MSVAAKSGVATGTHSGPDLEPFAEFAEMELNAAPLHKRGVCFNPDCNARFKPARYWQQYCCKACQRAGQEELRQVGNRAAPALLAWQATKYAKPGTPEGNLQSAARRYLARLQRQWVQDRARRAAEAGQ